MGFQTLFLQARSTGEAKKIQHIGRNFVAEVGWGNGQVRCTTAPLTIQAIGQFAFVQRILFQVLDWRLLGEVQIEKMRWGPS